MKTANQALEQTLDSVLRYGESVGCEMLNFCVRRTAAIRRLTSGLPCDGCRCDNATMTTRVEQIAEQVKSLPLSEREELLAWLADFELGQVDAWDQEIPEIPSRVV